MPNPAEAGRRVQRLPRLKNQSTSPPPFRSLRNRAPLRHSSLGIPSSFVLRPSSFAEEESRYAAEAGRRKRRTFGKSIKPSMCWQVRIHTVMPGFGTPNRATYISVMSLQPSTGGGDPQEGEVLHTANTTPDRPGALHQDQLRRRARDAELEGELAVNGQVEVQRTTTGQNHGACNHVAQFPHMARPALTLNPVSLLAGDLRRVMGCGIWPK